MAQDGQRRRSAGGVQPQVSEALPPAIADALFGRGAGFTAYQQATGMGAGMNTAMPPAVAAAALAAESAAAEPAAPAGLRGDRARTRGQGSSPTSRQPVTSGSQARRNSRGQGSGAGSGAQPQSNPLPQTTGRSITEASLPPVSMEQARANAAATLGQLNLAQLSALQSVMPQRPEPISVEDQILQTAFDGITQAFEFSQREGASAEEAAAGRAAFMEQLFALANRGDVLAGFAE